MARTVVVVCGPTAAGKTALGVALAHRLNGEVVSADSMQLYRGMDIGTAKPTVAEREGVPHHMLDVADPRENYSVAKYVPDATACIEDIFTRGKQPILVGGTGLYLDAVIAGRDFAPFDPDDTLRAALQSRLAGEGGAALLAELAGVDPATAARLSPGDGRRIVRALEVYYATGTPLSVHNAVSRTRPARYRAARIGLAFAHRTCQWRRIDSRVDEMMAAGLLEEVSGLLAAGVPACATAMQAIGYKELAAPPGTEGDLLRAVEDIKLRSRQYGKRQLTWFRHTEGVHWHLWEDTPDFSAALRDSTAYLKEFGLG